MSNKALRVRPIVSILFFAVISVHQPTGAVVPLTVNYQGVLKSGGTPVNGLVNSVFTIYDAESDGNVIWQETHSNLNGNPMTVNNGLFSVILGLQTPLPSAVFEDTARWLGMKIGADPELQPRTKFTSVAFAHHAARSDTSQVAQSLIPSVVGAAEVVDASILFEDISQNGASAGEVIKWNGTTWIAATDEGAGGPFLPLAGGAMVGPISSSGDPAITMGKGNFGGGNDNSGAFAFVAGQHDTAAGEHASVSGGHLNRVFSATGVIGGGYDNVITSGNNAATIAGGQSNTIQDMAAFATIGGGFNNTVSAVGGSVAGGQDNAARQQWATVSGGWQDSASGYHATVAGGWLNRARGDNSTIGGGYNNTVDSSGSTIGGGEANTTLRPYSTVGGGLDNHANGEQSVVCGGRANLTLGKCSAVLGGANNQANSPYSTVSGGDANYIPSSGGGYGTVSGGYLNEVYGAYGSIPGGADNEVRGAYSLAAGRNAKAASGYDGCFVWADGTGAGVQSTAANQFQVLSSGGVNFFTNTAKTAGVSLAAGGGSWASVSDFNAKNELAPVDVEGLLEKLSQMRITTWSYKTQDSSIRHIGPMAQDFHAAFGVGEDDKHITTIDADGVALAAIQALYQRNLGLQQRNDELTARLSELEDLVNRLVAKQR